MLLLYAMVVLLKASIILLSNTSPSSHVCRQNCQKCKAEWAQGDLGFSRLLART